MLKILKTYKKDNYYVNKYHKNVIIFFFLMVFNFVNKNKMIILIFLILDEKRVYFVKLRLKRVYNVVNILSRSLINIFKLGLWIFF